jgi:hypothetical protein
MLKITDADRTKEVEIPDDLVGTIGVLKDMVDSPAIPGSEPVSEASFDD